MGWVRSRPATGAGSGPNRSAPIRTRWDAGWWEGRRAAARWRPIRTRRRGGSRRAAARRRRIGPVEPKGRLGGRVERLEGLDRLDRVDRARLGIVPRRGEFLVHGGDSICPGVLPEVMTELCREPPFCPVTPNREHRPGCRDPAGVWGGESISSSRHRTRCGGRVGVRRRAPSSSSHASHRAHDLGQESGPRFL